MPRIAFHTLSFSPTRCNFVIYEREERVSSVFDEAWRSGGCVNHAVRIDPAGTCPGWDFGRPLSGPPGPDLAGPPREQDLQLRTLSLWTGIDALRRFAGRRLHRVTLPRPWGWLLRPARPEHAIWWVSDDEVPTWHEASERLAALRSFGPSASAFDLSLVFDAQGFASGSPETPAVRAGGDHRHGPGHWVEPGALVRLFGASGR